VATCTATAVGNLLIVALWEQPERRGGRPGVGGPAAGRARQVLPMSAVPLDLHAIVRGHDPDKPDEISTVRGQATCADPGRGAGGCSCCPPTAGVPEAVQAVLDADWCARPGSWFSSVIPHLLVPELADALMTTRLAGCSL